MDTHGEVAARICPILRMNGYMESDQVSPSTLNSVLKGILDS